MQLHIDCKQHSQMNVSNSFPSSVRARLLSVSSVMLIGYLASWIPLQLLDQEKCGTCMKQLYSQLLCLGQTIIINIINMLVSKLSLHCGLWCVHMYAQLQPRQQCGLKKTLFCRTHSNIQTAKNMNLVICQCDSDHIRIFIIPCSVSLLYHGYKF